MFLTICPLTSPSCHAYATHQRTKPTPKSRDRNANPEPQIEHPKPHGPCFLAASVASREPITCCAYCTRLTQGEKARARAHSIVTRADIPCRLGPFPNSGNGKATAVGTLALCCGFPGALARLRISSYILRRFRMYSGC